MPLVIGTGSPPVVTPPVDVVGPAPTPAIDLERLDVTWTAPDGTVWSLSDRQAGWKALKGAVYAGAAPIDLTADPNPRYGARVRHIQPQPRLITLPVEVRGPTHTEFIGRWRQLASAFTQTRRLGPGLLTVAQPDGVRRQIAAYYQAGWEHQAGNGWDYDVAVVQLFCQDPYWSDVTPTVVTRQYSATSSSFTDTFPTVSSSQTLGATTINNPGDTEAWPAWTLTGPASSLTATNNTTGESFVLTPVGGAMTGGQVATITTDPPSVIGTDGVTSWIGGLNWPSAALWALQPGDNNVTFTVGGSGSGTEIALTFSPRYETP